METQILAHLTGQLTPEIVSEIQSPALISSITSLVLIAAFIIGIISLITAIGNALKKSPSKQYRELLSDMYVVGVIKKLANADEINLKEELKEFARIERKANIKAQDIDSVIADNLKEKIDAKAEKELDKIEKEF